MIHLKWYVMLIVCAMRAGQHSTSLQSLDIPYSLIA
jgi:hypothetical protein